MKYPKLGNSFMESKFYILAAHQGEGKSMFIDNEMSLKDFMERVDMANGNRNNESHCQEEHSK
jgi:hypothetical protein